MQNIIFFIDNIATQYFLWLLLTPYVLAFIAYFLFPKLKGKKVPIILIIILIICVGIIFPLIFGIRSLIINKQTNQIIALIGIVIMFSVLGFAFLQYKFLYAWLDDEAFKKITVPPDGSHVDMKFPKPIKLMLAAYYIATYLCLGIVGWIYLVISAIFNWGYAAPCIVIAIGGFMAILHVAFRWVMKCPYCHFNIFEFEKDKKRHIKFIPIVRQIIRKHEFNCMYCKAHFTVKPSNNK